MSLTSSLTFSLNLLTCELQRWGKPSHLGRQPVASPGWKC